MSAPWLRHPIEKWQHEISKASKAGLLECIDNLTMFRGIERETLMKMAKSTRSAGRHLDAMADHARYVADPKGETQRWYKRQLAAKKAARTRKRNTKRRAA